MHALQQWVAFSFTWNSWKIHLIPFLRSDSWNNVNLYPKHKHKFGTQWHGIWSLHKYLHPWHSIKEKFEKLTKNAPSLRPKNYDCPEHIRKHPLHQQYWTEEAWSQNNVSFKNYLCFSDSKITEISLHLLSCKWSQNSSPHACAGG